MTFVAKLNNMKKIIGFNWRNEGKPPYEMNFCVCRGAHCAPISLFIDKSERPMSTPMSALLCDLQICDLRYNE